MKPPNPETAAVRAIVADAQRPSEVQGAAEPASAPALSTFVTFLRVADADGDSFSPTVYVDELQSVAVEDSVEKGYKETAD
jgi:hypothetical protein